MPVCACVVVGDGAAQLREAAVWYVPVWMERDVVREVRRWTEKTAAVAAVEEGLRLSLKTPTVVGGTCYTRLKDRFL